jgi:uncharacterized protein (DUF2384 family)
MATSSPSQTPIVTDKSAATLSKAFLNAARELGVSQAAVADVLGVSDATASRFFAGTYQLNPSRKYEWEFALLFVRIYRSLTAIVGAGEPARTWLHGENKGLVGRPIELIRTAQGLIRVLEYLDSFRGRI